MYDSQQKQSISDLEHNGGRIAQIGDHSGMKLILNEFNSHETCEGLLFYTNSPRLKPFGATRLSRGHQGWFFEVSSLIDSSAM